MKKDKTRDDNHSPTNKRENGGVSSRSTPSLDARKGCGKMFTSYDKGRVGCKVRCGFQYRKHTRVHLCPSCSQKKQEKTK